VNGCVPSNTPLKVSISEKFVVNNSDSEIEKINSEQKCKYSAISFEQKYKTYNFIHW
jgi:hypothetical protein